MTKCNCLYYNRDNKGKHVIHITNLEWDENNMVHISRHGVIPEEVEKVCFSEDCFIEVGRGKVYYVTGQSESGRYLFVVLRYLGRGKARVITARDMDEKEKSRYKKKRD